MLLQITSMALTVAIMPDIITPDARSAVPFADNRRHESLPADETILRGWPVDLNSPGAGFPYTPLLYDIDEDGACEIFLTGGHTFGLSGSGGFLPGWPVQEMAYMATPPPGSFRGLQRGT